MCGASCHCAAACLSFNDTDVNGAFPVRGPGRVECHAAGRVRAGRGHGRGAVGPRARAGFTLPRADCVTSAKFLALSVPGSLYQLLLPHRAVGVRMK